MSFDMGVSRDGQGTGRDSLTKFCPGPTRPADFCPGPTGHKKRRDRSELAGDRDPDKSRDKRPSLGVSKGSFYSYEFFNLLPKYLYRICEL